MGRFHPFDPATGETQWEQRNYLHMQTPVQTVLEPTPEKPSEANVQGFLQQAERADRESKPRLDSDDDLPFDNNDETPF